MQVKIIVWTTKHKYAGREMHTVVLPASVWNLHRLADKVSLLAKILCVEEREIAQWSESSMRKVYGFGDWITITGSPENGNEFVGRWGVIVQELLLCGEEEHSYLVAVENNNFGGGLLLCPRKASELAPFNGG